MLRIGKNLLKPRYYSTGSRPSHEIFDRSVKLQQKRLPLVQTPEEFKNVQYLKNESIKKIISTLSFINRKFKNTLDIGSSYGHLESLLASKPSSSVNTSITGDESNEDEVFAKEVDMVKSKFKNIYMLDSCKEMLDMCDHKAEGLEFTKIHGDEESLDHEMLTNKKFNCIISNLCMHWINNLPEFLVKTYNLLDEKDSIFIGSMFAQDTLFELRSSLQLAEMERKGGLSPHVSPFVTVQDLGNLLNRAGYKMVTIDIDEVVIDYPDLLTIMDELKLMGENNCLFEREPLSKETLLAADPIYRKFYGVQDETGRTIYPATFRVLFFIGWRDKEIKSAKRGSQNVDLKKIL
ncbi:hypothetical protein DASC09_061670 [Saccharomycopsis crataegensis]|uniref:NADH dehydrogenase [ubiquinone] 1 alpha subcomplex assembly factor 5 n=1 Tax=Saccharomycopsis crataegensis TaxID=43959 RepID=A0AAV5QVF3_9ASCO|nr:hypothetical protein DASC09_061670 [Saccharomycopsis crataegensis]